MCIGILSVQSVDSGQRACTCLHVASSVWHILMHSVRVRLEPFEIHCYYAFVLEKIATIEFLVSLSLQSPTHAKLYRSTILLTSCIYADKVLLPWFRTLKCVKAAISSDFGLVQSSGVSNMVLMLLCKCVTHLPVTYAHQY